MSKSVDDWFEDLTEFQQSLLVPLRKLVRSTGKTLTEEIKWGQPCYGGNRLVCYFKKASAHVVLGFQQGAHLPDPDELLEGSGKDMRHIKIHSKDDIRTAPFKALLKAAIRYDTGKA